MEIKEIIHETPKAFLVKIEHEGIEYKLWTPKSRVQGFNIDDTFAQQKIDEQNNNYSADADREMIGDDAAFGLENIGCK